MDNQASAVLWCRRVSILGFSLLSLGLTGCASWLAPYPPTPPTPQEIRSYLAELHDLEHGTQLTGDVSATSVATAGYALVDTQCSRFFSAVLQWTSDTGFNRKEIALGGAAAAGILAAVGAAAKTIAITAIGITLAAESLDNFQNFALFTPKPTVVSKLVSEAMTVYRNSAPPSDSTIMTDVPTAQSYVSGYADLCTYHRIQNFVEQAVAKATPVDTNATPASLFSSEDQLLLAGVNGALGLPPALLSDAKYVQLYWYLQSAYLNDANRNKVLNEFKAIEGKLWNSQTNTLPNEAQTAAKILETIAKKNPALVKAAKALEEANTPPPPGVVAAPRGIITPSMPRAPVTLPRIGIR